ncbi:cell division protein FtsQ [Polaribacter sp.]|uniref:cell division protein FtsQ/DivIB n=1 Tax=Polaribacter sp. TaxID=1920175 RepID=UPI0025DE0197|nr:cell division protein FtsQ [Polaribacter sp.]
MKFKRSLKYLFFLLTIAGLGLLFAFSSKRNEAIKVGVPLVDFASGDNNFLTHSMVNKLLIQNPKKMQNNPKSMIDLYNLENNVSNNPYVAKADVFLTVDGKLISVVKQREPIARILGDGEAYYIDKQGVKMPLSVNYSSRVLLVLGIFSEEEIIELLKLITAIKKDDFLHKEIVGIEKSAENEFQFSMRSGDYKIDFGNLTKIDLKFKKLKAFYNTTFEDKTIQNYKTINVKYHNQVVCTK